MKQHRGTSQPSPATDAAAGSTTSRNRTAAHHHVDDAGAALAAARFPLLRRLSLVSLLAMLATATLLILLYRQDQIEEHEELAARDNEKTATHLAQMMGEQFDAYIAATAGLDAQALRSNPVIGTFNAALGTVREHDILKLKLYDPAGTVIFSTVPDDVGGASRNPRLLQKALASGTQHQFEFRDTFRTLDGEIRNRYILATYVPLSHAEKRSGVLEIYLDVTPLFERINARIAYIALAIFGIFAALYAGLFLIARRADRAIANDTLKLSESEARLWVTINSALDAVVSIDAESRLIGFNPSAEAMFGWRREEALGQEMTGLLLPERYREQHRDGLARYMQSGETRILNRRFEITALRRDGTEFLIELTITPIREGDHLIFTAFIRDISERKQSEEELRESRAFHQSVTEAMGEIGIGLFIVDADLRVRYMNSVMKDWFGDQTGQICYSSLCGVAERCEHCEIEQVIGGNGTVHYSPTGPGGRVFDIIATPIQNGDGTISKLEVIRDVTDHRQAEQELRIAAKAFDSQEGMFITDADGIIQRVNKAFIETTGYSAEEVVGKTPSLLKSGKHDATFYRVIREALERDGYWQGEVWNRRKNGEIYPEWQTISAVKNADGQTSHYISAFTDISLRKQTEEQIRNLAFYDPLTQLPNRRLLLDRLNQALASSMRTGKQGALLFIDLDNFKSINDTRGHVTGDLLLVEAAQRLQGCIREGDTTARLGGDEFVVLIDDMDSDEQVAATQAEIVGEKYSRPSDIPISSTGTSCTAPPASVSRCSAGR